MRTAPELQKRISRVALYPGKTCRGIALCAGAAGLELGIRIAVPGARTVCYVERDSYAAAALVARMAETALHQAPVWDDIATFDGKAWRGKIHFLTAGYPCQPFSYAGKRKGESDPRHLWPHVRRILEETAAPLIFCENVPGHLSCGFDQVVQDLEAMDYGVKAIVVSAAEVGASQLRERLFFLGYAHGSVGGVLAGFRDNFKGLSDGEAGLSGPNKQTDAMLDLSVAHGASPTPTDRLPLFAPPPDDLEAWLSVLSKHPGLQPALLRDADGLANRLDRRRLAGNGVVPLAAAHAFRALVFAACE